MQCKGVVFFAQFRCWSKSECSFFGVRQEKLAIRPRYRAVIRLESDMIDYFSELFFYSFRNFERVSLAEIVSFNPHWQPIQTLCIVKDGRERSNRPPYTNPLYISNGHRLFQEHHNIWNNKQSLHGLPVNQSCFKGALIKLAKNTWEHIKLDD